mmetsp:Transcript_11779/g.29528  ORF Transcript_11779/g.29528 Transcript_11779/m.29528 type:complete len:245 (-) Transcript_11779:3-737(-)
MARTKPIDDGRSSTAPVLPMVPSAKDSPTGQPRFGSLETITSSGYCSSSSKHARDDTSAVASSTSTALGGRGVDAHRASVVWLASPAVSARLTCFAGLGGTRATWLRRVALEEAVGGDHLVHRDGLDLLVAVEPVDDLGHLDAPALPAQLREHACRHLGIPRERPAVRAEEAVVGATLVGKPRAAVHAARLLRFDEPRLGPGAVDAAERTIARRYEPPGACLRAEGQCDDTAPEGRAARMIAPA